MPTAHAYADTPTFYETIQTTPVKGAGFGSLCSLGKMAVENGEFEEDIEVPSFTIGEPSEPVPQSAVLHDHHIAMDKGVSYDEVDFQST